MGEQVEWHRIGYTSRVDMLADRVAEFAKAVLGTIDESAARASRERWAVVCRFFAGCARAARAQGNTPDGGGDRMVAYFKQTFRCAEGGSAEGFDEFMDWLSDPAAFRSTRLRPLLERA
jgi:hypothetical protein